MKPMVFAVNSRVDPEFSPFLPIKCPACKEENCLTEPRSFNLMFQTHVGALEDAASLAYLRPETAQGIFANFKNVMDSTRVKIPFGIAQMGKAFRNEINPRNYTFRSREFEQMEIEFFCHPNESMQWYEFWRDLRIRWYESLNIRSERLRPRQQDEKELAHYSRACTDIEYLFPFSDEPQELEGVAHRGSFDLNQHGKFSRNDENAFAVIDDSKEKYVPHVIEPSAGVDRFALATICEAYTYDESRQPGVLEVPPAAGADQGGGVPPGRQGRHAGDRRADLPRNPQALHLSVRRQAVHRQALRPHGRGRHAVLLHHRRPKQGGRHSHGTKPRRCLADPNRQVSLCGIPARSVEDLTCGLRSNSPPNKEDRHAAFFPPMRASCVRDGRFVPPAARQSAG